LTTARFVAGFGWIEVNWTNCWSALLQPLLQRQCAKLRQHLVTDSLILKIQTMASVTTKVTVSIMVEKNPGSMKFLIDAPPS
jgi:hypothetical protein